MSAKIFSILFIIVLFVGISMAACPSGWDLCGTKCYNPFQSDCNCGSVVCSKGLYPCKTLCVPASNPCAGTCP
ncbi:hypothetical protein PPL_11512 [Heterostelium album PN500]|uniref:Uncharacterized protein n=1 Tax=Heterostelium pallidum (strain ATCC 26659 / Pp 5 / PN500) TaxID=670386 RepID=D3BTL5_HETP5|nr:hypothetical protein PPL_11512 [Heterostelium album PN500]EFA75432.1 hypothetical protein PPL_11512 [Heterostelium album PN500]|eukprot:XP_020427566.1 hypothetical protein PPL_11512 [Heterostelium album PN500]